MVIVEQNLSVVSRMADRVYIMKEGSIFKGDYRSRPSSSNRTPWRVISKVVRSLDRGKDIRE